MAVLCVNPYIYRIQFRVCVLPSKYEASHLCWKNVISGIFKFLFVLKIIIVVTTISHSPTRLHEVIGLEET